MFLDSRIQIWTPLPPPPPPSVKKKCTQSHSLHLSPLRCRFSQQDEAWHHLMKSLILFCSFVIYMFFWKHFVLVACFELNLLDFFLFSVSFTGNYIDNFICDRVYYTTVGSGLSQCLCRNKRKATFCCSNLFNHRYAGRVNFFLYWCRWSLVSKI